MSFDWFSVAAVVLGLAALVGFDLLARAKRRKQGADRGDYWAQVVWWLCIVLGPLLFLSGLFERVPVIWQSGWHLYLDLTNAFDLAQDTRYVIALGIPFAYWLALLLVGFLRRPKGREAGRWLAGAVGYGNSRLWILLLAVPLVLVLAFNHGGLNRGVHGYPAGAWSTQAVLLLSLAGVAFSAGRKPSESVADGVPPPPRAAGRPPWPEVMKGHGVAVELVTAWKASAAPRGLRGASAEDLAERLGRMGARSVAPELVEAIDELLTPMASGKTELAARLVFAPDNCGQEECVALASSLLRQRFQATTLVVTVDRAAVLAERLRRWIPSEDAVAAIGSTGEGPKEAQVWVVDAETLSDRLLSKLKEPAMVSRIGLVVWWHLESYTGVLAANLWAISRRLHRLIHTRGRHDVRTLALMRSAPYGSAQPSDFVRRLLPHPFPSESVAHVERRFQRPVELYHLGGHRNYFARGDGKNIRDSLRHPALVAAKVSVEAGWATHLEVPSEVAGAGDFLQLSAAGAKLGERLSSDVAQADVRLRSIEAGEVLSLLEIVCQGGRAADGAADPRATHYVGFATPHIPYVDYLLKRLGNTDSEVTGFESSRRLVCAEAHRSIFQRHLLLALNEQPDTRNGLLKNFLWNEEVIRETLDRISHEGKLTREEVRFLDDSDRLVIDYEYKSKRLPAGERRPLDTVGAELVEVRDPAAGFDEEEGVRLRVDPERLTIEAYPHRVFLYGEKRYRIREWSSPEEVVKRGWLECRQVDEHCLTWRVRNSFVFGIEPFGKAAGIGRKGRLLTRLTVDLNYEEEVTGAINLTPDLTSGNAPELETLLHAHPLTQSFATRALVLRFPEPEEPIALLSLCQALRHVLPVHLGVEEDALEVVALLNETIDEMQTYGVAIVDLYPGGIGLVDAIRDDNTLILQLLTWTRSWLESCPCQSDAGCEECLRSPAALAANSDQPPLRPAALHLLGQIV